MGFLCMCCLLCWWWSHLGKWAHR